jgi:hypothetical protein
VDILREIEDGAVVETLRAKDDRNSNTFSPLA